MYANEVSAGRVGAAEMPSEDSHVIEGFVVLCEYGCCKMVVVDGWINGCCWMLGDSVF